MKLTFNPSPNYRNEQSTVSIMKDLLLCLLALILLAVGITATSVLSAVLVGVLVFFLWLTVAASACYVRCAADCD